MSRFCESVGICFQLVSEQLVELPIFSKSDDCGRHGRRHCTFYEGDLEVSQRFPGLSGKLLIDAIMCAYIEPMTRTIPFFSSSGELLFRHAENQRPIDASLEKYTKLLRNEGLVPGVRGLPWCTPSGPTNTSDREMAYDLMSFATLTHERWPNDAQIQATI